MNDWRKRRTLGERVRWAITVHAGKTINQFAKDARIRQSTLSSIVNGNTKRTTKIPEIAAKTGLDARWLGTGEGTPYLSGGLSPSAHAVGRRFDELTAEQQSEVVRYVDMIIARDRQEPTARLLPLKATIENLTHH